MPRKSTPRILFVAQDAGGFAVVYPVYKKLKHQNPRRIWGIFSDVSKNLVKEKNIPFVDAKTVMRERLGRIFDAKKPDLLVVGTSAGLSIDKIATDIARKKGIPSVAIIDYWSNYILRFSDPRTRNMAYLTDRIFVMDEVCKREMVKEGFDPQRIRVTGSPAFDKFKTSFSRAGRRGSIVFVSQPFSELKKNDSGIDYGYDEREVFADLLEALECLNVTQEIVVKHHPRTQDLTVFDGLIAKSHLRIRTDCETPTDKILARSTLVLGMSTMALFEAALRGKPVLSYQPHLSREDPLMSNRLGLSLSIYEKSKLVPVLKKLLRAKHLTFALARARRKYAHGHATQDVINCLLKKT